MSSQRMAPQKSSIADLSTWDGLEVVEISSS
jgi:hypothetical protein